MGHAHIEHHHNRCTCAHEQGRFSNGFCRSAPGARHISASSAFPLVCAAHAKDCSTECMRVHCQTGRQLHARTHLRARCRRPTPQKLNLSAKPISSSDRNLRPRLARGLPAPGAGLPTAMLRPRPSSSIRAHHSLHHAATPSGQNELGSQGQRWLLSGTRAWLRLNNNDFVGATN